MVKTYADFMNEISKEELYRGLLAHGLFPEKLPPIFTSEPFFNYCQGLKQSFTDKAYHYIYQESIRNINLVQAISDLISIPLYGKIASGTPIAAIRDEGQTIDLPSNLAGQGEHYALSVDGDSMINAGIDNNDTIIVKKCSNAEDG